MAQDLSYYLPAGVTYDPAVPKPAQVIYHEVGQWHVTHDRLVNYMQALAKAVPQPGRRCFSLSHLLAITPVSPRSESNTFS